MIQAANSVARRSGNQLTTSNGRQEMWVFRIQANVTLDTIRNPKKPTIVSRSPTVNTTTWYSVEHPDVSYRNAFNLRQSGYSNHEKGDETSRVSCLKSCGHPAYSPIWHGPVPVSEQKTPDSTMDPAQQSAEVTGSVAFEPHPGLPHW